ncbi:MAG: hypothetical protein EOR57_32755 [Mesorhizobium sp.]|uniref:P-loop NTPase n=1 Tax=Mesorhizobium sp. TaxID=1871066 RepID=UPI000FEA3AE9|nr:hypothetical protein [Mesorhizobium sp.]RWL13644.1 MAG: hypothetical protein EOR57_32755 [Mesorhizobium sp.]
MTSIKNDASGEQLLREALANDLPVVGYLGQAAGIAANSDTILKAALRKVNRSGNSWRSLFAGGGDLDANFFTWLGEGFLASPVGAELSAIADTPFSAVYTSSIDPRLPRLFETNGREPETILFGDPPPPIKRSRRRPPIYQLFGRAGGETADFQPPSSTQSLARRRMLHASPMARTMLETATALGLIVVEGLREGDWFRAEDILALLADAAPNSVVWFGDSPSFGDEDSQTFEQLIASGIIVREPRSLGRVLAQIAASEPQLLEQRWDDPGVVTFASGKRLVTSPSLRLATEASATIVDDAFTAFLPPLREANQAADFRAFHATSGNARLLIAGVRRGYSFVRDFEGRLRSLVDKAVLRHYEERGAIVVHGQSGTGKSIALVQLALHLREAKTAAVLLALNSLPQATDVVEFLAAVDNEDEVTVVLVDASLSVSRYDDFLDALRSRGHRVVVVGTSYRQDSPPNGIRSRLVEATSRLSIREHQELAKLAAKAGLNEIAIKDKEAGDYALPGFFYRLPASRVRISEGLGREARHVSANMKAVGSIKREVDPLGDLGKALVEAGFPKPTSTILEEEGAVVGNWGSETAANRLIDYVMASARLYQWVPVNLVLRAVMRGTEQREQPLDLDAIRTLFEGHDLFRWRLEDNEGHELLVSARLQLEAELICNRRLGGPTGEANRLSELIRVAVRAGSEGNSETRFLIDLIHAFGPDGPFKERYSESYAELARTLTNLRKNAGVVNARLMLQEATLRRHYIRLRHPEPQVKAALLDEARTAVDDALSQSEARNSRVYASRRTIDNLWVERAATYGFMATDAAEGGDNPTDVWPSYLAARTAVRKALGRVDSYFPLDIGLWLPARILKSSAVSMEHSIELEADIRATLDLVDPGALDAKQFEIFQRQRLSCAEVLNDTAVSDDAFALLQQSGSTAGYFLRARQLAPSPPDAASQATADDISKAEQSKRYLWNVYPQVAGDPRCLRLLLSCEWVATTGTWLFKDQRQPLPWAQADRSRIRRIRNGLPRLPRHENRRVEEVNRVLFYPRRC